MQIDNEKLVKRGIISIKEESKIGTEETTGLLNKYGSVKETLSHKHI